MRQFLPLVAVFFLLLICSSAFAVISRSSMQVFAVTDSGGALSADLIVELRPGSGKIWSGVEPLIGTSTQTTEKLAVNLAKKYSSAVDKYDYYFDINSSASLVDGPSAGAAMSLLVITMLQGRKLPDYIALTGTITADGGVGAVGGVFEKSKEAARTGIRLFLIPVGESRQTVKLPSGVQSMNLIDYAGSEWGMKVVEVNGIDDVLRYAFMEIGQIDVNAGRVVMPDFIPAPITFAPNLYAMHSLAGRYTATADESVRRARNTLSGSLLNDQGLVEVLLRYLNDAEEMLSESRVLFDQNYLYSSANYSFLAIVYSQFVEDIANSPELVSTSSTMFDNRIRDLGDKVDSLAIDLNQFVPIDRFEWHVAAEQRLSWARLNVEKITKNNQITITINGPAVEESRVDDLLDYEFAAAWYNASKDFYDLSKPGVKRILNDSQLLNGVENYISNAEKGLVSLTESEAEDAQRRLESAKMMKEIGWTYAALFDSASALALVNAAIFVKNKDLNFLQAELGSRIEALSDSIGKSGKDFVWAQLYLDHAKYYLNASVFYQKQGQGSRALDSAKSGISLVFMAENVFESASASYDYFGTIPPSKFLPVVPVLPALAISVQILLVLVVAIIALVCFILFLLSSRGKIRLTQPSLEGRIMGIVSQQKRLKSRLEAGMISADRFKKLDTQLQDEFGKLVSERREISKIFVELDLSKSKLFAFERTLRELKKQFNSGEITEEDYRENIEFYGKWIGLLRREIIKEMQEMKMENEEIRDILNAPKKAPRKREKRK